MMGGKKGGGRSKKQAKSRIVGGLTLQQQREVLELVRKMQTADGGPVHQTYMRFEAGSNPTIIVSKDSAMAKFESTVHGSVGALSQGENSTAVNLGNIGTASKEDAATYLTKLGPELTKLLEAMKQQKDAANPEHDVDLTMISQAEVAAKAGDPSKVVAFLKRSGKWAGDVATRIGASIAAEAIMKASGMKP